MATAAERAGMNRWVLAEAVQIDGGIVALFLLVMLLLFIGFIVLCWAAYRAGAGNRTGQIVVGLASLYLVVSVFTFGVSAAIPLISLAGFAVMGRVRSRR